MKHPIGLAVTAALLLALVGCRELAAPSDCGFPPGTELTFAGRATTAELGVQEVVGDPMSTEPADIYVTRDPFTQGELRGRLVCAVFIHHPGFVEITVHPDDGGRWVPPALAPPVPAPSAGIHRAEAIEIALGEVGEPETWQVATESGPLKAMMGGYFLDLAWAADVSGDLWVWRVVLVRDDVGIDVVIDYEEGSILGTARYIVN